MKINTLVNLAALFALAFMTTGCASKQAPQKEVQTITALTPTTAGVKAKASIAQHYAKKIEEKGTAAGSEESKEVVTALKSFDEDVAALQTQIHELTALYLKAQKDTQTARDNEAAAKLNEAAAKLETGDYARDKGRWQGFAFALAGLCVPIAIGGFILGKLWRPTGIV